uniref:F-box domain-containing protein n=1 Tax=viral metagenome TaxID=1070528 RepID=A0A6C0C6N3_9ZZZZ
MQSLPIEIYNHITSNLDSYGLHSLSHTCKQFFPKYSKHITTKINERLLSIFGDNLPALKKMMQKTGCVISGSFIIQCLLNETWKDSDIDFYVSTQGNEITKTNSGYNKSAVDDFMYNVMRYDGSIDDQYADIENNPIKYVRTYKHLRNMRFDARLIKINPKMQIIGIDVAKNANSMFDYIVKTFDFNICKNMYYYDGYDHIRSNNNFDEIFLKETTFEMPNIKQIDIQSNLARYCKYKNRGIAFKNVPSFDHLSQFKLNKKWINSLSVIIVDPIDWDSIYYTRCTTKDLKEINASFISYQYRSCSIENCVITECFNMDHKHITTFCYDIENCVITECFDMDHKLITTYSDLINHEFIIFDKKID